MAHSSDSNYRWYILTLGGLTHAFALGMPMTSMPVLFKEISEDLNLSLVEIGTVWGMTTLAGIFVVLIGGLLGDRFGVKRILSVACILMGLAMGLRGLSVNFITLAATVFLFGLPGAVISLNVHKTAGIWFPPRHLALANSILAVGMGVGHTLGAMISATVLSPLLGGWRNVMFLYGVICIVIGGLWLLSRGESSKVESSASDVRTVGFRQALSQVVRIRTVWLLGFIHLGRRACLQGMTGYLPLHLRGIGWMPTSADAALAAFYGAGMIGAIPVAVLSDRLGSRKAILLAALLMSAIGVGMLSIVNGTMVWALVIIVGIFYDGAAAIFLTMIMETDRVGTRYAGTAIGLVYTISRMGSVVSPPIGNSLADINTGLPFIFWAALAAAALFGFYFVKETRQR